MLVGCGGSQPQVRKLSEDAVIMAFGNSLTSGTGVGPGSSYPTVLQQLTGRAVVNAGVPGEVSASGLQRLPGVVDKARPALVILLHGGNDILRKRDLQETERNLRAMVGLLQERGIAVVLIGVPRPSLLLSTADFYDDVANDLDLPYDGNIVPELLGDNRYKSDTIHLNELGYRRLAEAVAGLLRRSGAL